MRGVCSAGGVFALLETVRATLQATREVPTPHPSPTQSNMPHAAEKRRHLGMPRPAFPQFGPPGVAVLSATPRYPDWAGDVEAGCAGSGLRVCSVPVGAVLPEGVAQSGWFANTRLARTRLLPTDPAPSRTCFSDCEQLYPYGAAETDE